MNQQLTNWLNEYSQSHQNPTNKRIHHVAVPIIFWSVMALLDLITIGISLGSFTLSVLWPVMLLVLCWYCFYSLIIGMCMGLLCAVGLLLIYLAQMYQINMMVYALVAFIIAWIAQFYGHKIEGKKPAFIRDLLFLLIGPIWVILPLLKKLNVKY
ncbi:DUF962 domain-containing protein [Catenovulum sp. SM1970]|uniref:Mpo1 family 2-hydroxy fatty acid dioxygenase n=1 Tax=Marinifaba aquimaris TaxID=2741323 RepID=UPI001571CCD6|nr:Mpo1-like protein [Marinifaba aquimaris]NTS78164.1 DUF962 domain-containing protein [Marinifaba aquimaris]